MPSPVRRSLRTLSGPVAVWFASAPAVASESTGHVDGGWFPGPGPILAVAGLVFAFGLFWVNVVVHVTVPWRRVERFGSREVTNAVGALTIVALGVVLVAEVTTGVGWYLLPAVLAIGAVGYASVAASRRTTVAAVTTSLVLFLVPAAVAWLLPIDGALGADVIRYPGLALVALAAGCFTHAAGAIGATYRTRTA